MKKEEDNTGPWNEKENDMLRSKFSVYLIQIHLSVVKQFCGHPE